MQDSQRAMQAGFEQFIAGQQHTKSLGAGMSHEGETDIMNQRLGQNQALENMMNADIANQPIVQSNHMSVLIAAEPLWTRKIADVANGIARSVGLPSEMQSFWGAFREFGVRTELASHAHESSPTAIVTGQQKAGIYSASPGV